MDCTATISPLPIATTSMKRKPALPVEEVPKPNGRPQALPTMADEFEVPEQIQAQADKYAAASNAKAKSVAKFNTARDGLIDAMKETGIHRVRVLTDLGVKIVQHDLADKLHFKKPEEKKQEAEA